MALAELSRAGIDDVPQPTLKVHDRAPSAPDADAADLTMSHRRLGARVREARKQAGRSQTEAAENLGISYQQWQKYEAGQNRLSAVSLHRLAGFLNADVRWLLGMLDADPPATERKAAPLGPHWERFAAAFGALREQDQEMILALAEHLVQNGTTGESHTALARLPAPSLMVPESRNVLLVDDDADSLTVVGGMLRNAGFNVTLASDGDMAFAKLAAEGPFDILVTDYAMPGLNGLALIDLARENQPDLPAVLISGYALDAGMRRLPPGVDVIAKPFTSGDIVTHVKLLGIAQSSRLIAGLSPAVGPPVDPAA